MKPRILLPGAILASSIIAQGAPVLPGTKFGIDYGPTSTANWNNFNANGNIAPGTVVLLNGSLSEVLEMTVTNGQFFNNDGTNNWVGLQSNATSIAPNPKAPPEFVDSVTTDIAGNFNLGDANPFRLVVSGLNPFLSYKVDSVSSAATGGNTESLTILGFSTYGPVAIARPATVTQGLFHRFASVVPTVEGQLTFESMDSGAGTNPIINGVLIEALAPTAEGLLDNDNDMMPNWWEVAYRLNPEDAADATADADGDGVTNLQEFNAGTDPRDVLSGPVIPTWAADGNGAWSTPSNWSPASSPNGQNRLARLSSDALLTAAAATISLDVPVTLAVLEVIGSKPFTLGAGNLLKFDTTAPDAQVRTAADAGSRLDLLGPVELLTPLRTVTDGTSEITMAGSLTGSLGITKTGTGRLILAGGVSGYSGDITVTGGSLVLRQTGSFSFNNLVLGAGSLVFDGGSTVLTLGNSHTGGTVVTGGGRLGLEVASALGGGVVTLDDGTLHAKASIALAGRSLNIGAGGAVIEVDSDQILTTGGSLPSVGEVEKVGAGIWRLQGGNASTVGLVTVSEGSIDFNRNDNYGNHSSSLQNLVIASGAAVTNGTGATGFTTFVDVTLAGGRLSVTNSLNALTGKFQAYGIRGSISAIGSAPSLINDLVEGANGFINIGGATDLGDLRGENLQVDVEDVTNSPAADLIISAKLKDSVGPIPAFVNLATGIEKTGAGTLVLSGANSYTGDTNVREGLVLIAQPYLAPTSDVLIDADAVLQLDFSGTNLIDQLVLDGIYQQPGVYGGEGSGADKLTSRISGSGTLTVSRGPDFSPFQQWMMTNHPSITAPDNAADADADGDGASNFVEFAYAGNPNDGGDTGFRRTAIVQIEGMDYLTLTLLLRTPFVFTGSGPLTGGRDGVNYTIRGSNDLADFGAGVVEIPALNVGLPSPPADYGYRSFRLAVPVSSAIRGFLQNLASPQTP